MLAVSHSGRGLFSTSDWGLVSRNADLSYPENGQAIGIGQVAGEAVRVIEIDHDGVTVLKSPDGRFMLMCETHVIEVKPVT